MGSEDPDVGREVVIPCRAKPNCAGRRVKITMIFPHPFGGKTIRYRCLTCNEVFTITL